MDGRERIIAAAAWLQDHHYALAALPAVAMSMVFGSEGNKPVQAAFSFILMDMATGCLKGAFWRCLTSQIAYAGLRKKLAMILSMVVGHHVDVYLGSGNSGKTLMAHYVIGVEFISICENLAAAGVVVPETLRALLQKTGAQERETGAGVDYLPGDDER